MVWFPDQCRKKRIARRVESIASLRRLSQCRAGIGNGPPRGLEQNRPGAGLRRTLGRGVKVTGSYQWIHKDRRRGESGNDPAFRVGFTWEGRR